jgi:hypothetical protein
MIVLKVFFRNLRKEHLFGRLFFQLTRYPSGYGLPVPIDCLHKKEAMDVSTASFFDFSWISLVFIRLLQGKAQGNLRCQRQTRPGLGI